jgi:hypothetical protein
MGPVDLIIHLFNFAAPAFFLGAVVPLAARMVLPQGTGMPAWWVQAAVNFAVGLLVLGAGLWFFGRDGKMPTYAALVAVCALCQWLLLRGWRK